MITKSLGFLISLLLFSGIAHAQGTTALGATTLIGFSNYFHKSVSIGPNEVTIYTGKTYNACSPVNSTTPCDSCANQAGVINGNMTCNRSEMDRTLWFSVTLSSANTAAYPLNCVDKAIVARAIGSGNTAIINSVPSYQNPQVPTTGQSVTAYFTWDSLYTLMGVSSTGTDSFPSKTIEFGFNASCNNSSLVDVGLRLNVIHRYISAPTGAMNFPCDGVNLQPGIYEGVCDYQAYRGDEKIYLQNIGVPNRDPNVDNEPLLVPDTTGSIGVSQDASGMIYDKLRVFCKPGNGNPYTLTLADVCADLQLDGRNINDPKIEGLTNGVQYEFLAGNVDQGGNLTYVTEPTTVGTLGVAIPEAVNGLLDGKSCFIATAAFGSDMAPEVQRFRDFRDQVLLKTSWGRTFVEYYYEFSPDAAKLIAHNEVLRTLTRFFLYPVLFLAETCQKYGFMFPIFASLFLFGVFRAQKRLKREKV